MLRVENLHFSFGPNQILKGISFDVDRGRLCGLFGPNGCGKTTLFRCCLGFLRFHSGSVFIDGQFTPKLTVKGLARLAAYVPQEHKPLFPYPVEEVVLMGRTPHLGGIFGVGRRDRMKAAAAIELLGISDIADQPYNRLSGGQRQMVLIARAIAQETKLLFLDEPTSSLDFSNQIRIWRIMRQAAERGVTIIACSHDPNHVSWFCDQVVVMDGRRVIANGSPAEVISERVLKGIYQDLCAVRKLGRANVVLPSEIADGGKTGTAEARK